MSSNLQPDEIGWANSGTEPSGGDKAAGFTTKLPAQWANWFWYLMSLWSTWFVERFTDYSASSSNLEIAAPTDLGGNFTIAAGDAPNTSNTNGGTLIASSGSARGTGSSAVTLYAATAGTTGSTERTVESYMATTGAGLIDLPKAIKFTSSNIKLRYPLVCSHWGALTTGTRFFSDGYWEVGNNSNGVYIAPLLPVGGVLTDVRVWCRQVAGSSNTHVLLDLHKYTLGTSATSSNIGSTNHTTSTTSDFAVLSGVNETISASHGYFLQVRSSVGSGTNRIGFVEFEITPGNNLYTRQG